MRLHLHLFAGLDWLLLGKTPTCPTTRTRLDSWTYLDSPDQLWNGKRGKSPAFVALLVFFPSFGLIALGEAIKIYKLDDYSGVAALNKPRFPKRY